MDTVACICSLAYDPLILMLHIHDDFLYVQILLHEYSLA